jgi:EAL domain-containing protein (putative c-di-GMP-specific phosphodiesterase class I)
MDREIVRSIVAIARERGSRTVAEHVVSAEIADVLLELGVDFAQGFHVGRPGPLPQAPGVASAGAGLDR